MEIILSRRIRNLILIFFFLILILLPLYNYFNSDVKSAVDRDFNELNSFLIKKSKKLINRANELYLKIKENGVLHEKNLYDNESVIVLKNGEIEEYFGNIYFFKIIKDNYKLILNNNFLYLVVKLNNETFYSSKILKFDFNFLSKFFNKDYYSSYELRKNVYDLKSRKDFVVFYRKVSPLNSSIEIIVDKSIFNKYKIRKLIYFELFAIFLILSIFIYLFYFKDLCFVRLSLLLSLIFLLKNLLSKNIEINLLIFKVNSLEELIVVLFVYYIILNKILDLIDSVLLSLIFFIVNILFSYFVINNILNAIRFDLTSFNFSLNYLLLILSLYVLLIILIFPLFKLLKVRRSRFLIIIEVFLISIFIISLLNSESVRLKKSYVEKFFKEAILNQNNYSKFLAREVVYEMNSKIKDFKLLFKKDMRYTLEKLWTSTLLMKENNPSGIFVIDNNGDIVNSFSYKIPFINIKKSNIFPFWAVYNTSSRLYGNTINLSVASIDVYDQDKYSGYIVIYVLNSYEKLISGINKKKRLIDRRFSSTDFNILRIDENNNVIENTLNLNIENVSELVKSGDNWLELNMQSRKYNVYVFELNNNKVLVLFRISNVFDLIADSFKAFILIILFAVIFGIIDLRINYSKRFFNSFSFKVFLILLLVSFISSLVFVVFSINYNKTISDLREKEILIESGYSVKNIVSDIIETRGEIDINDVYMIANLINNDINVYENNILLYSSDYGNLVERKYPLYINSFIVKKLNENYQRLIVDEFNNSFNLYFMKSNYVFNILPSKSVVFRKRDIYSYYNLLVNIFILIMLIAFILSWFFRKRIVKPVNLLENAMYQVKSGENKKLNYIPKESEFKSIFMGFNSMVDGIEEQKEKISELSKMSTIVNLARRVAHEVKNPLTPIKLSAEQIIKLINSENIDKAMIIKAVKYIIEETEHLKKVSYGFLDLSRLDKLELSEFDLKELFIREISQILQINKNIKINLKAELENYKVFLDKTKIKQLIKNLLNNSIESIKSNGEIVVKLLIEKEFVKLEISDNGEGIDKEFLDRIFDKGFSTKDYGSGLGLYIVKRIVDMHKGEINIDSVKNKGTKVRIKLPIMFKG